MRCAFLSPSGCRVAGVCKLVASLSRFEAGLGKLPHARQGCRGITCCETLFNRKVCHEGDVLCAPVYCCAFRFIEEEMLDFIVGFTF